MTDLLHYETHVRGAPQNRRIVAIGSSTGGPQALQTVITGLPEHFPCPVVARVEVREACDGDVLRPGCVYIAPGNRQLRVRQEGGGRRIALSDEPPVGNHRPAVNVMYDSVAHLGNDVVAVILTGMGCDGREGMRRIKQNGGYCIAQDEATCVVYGMPKSVVDAGLADEICPLPKIAGAIQAAVRR